MVEVFFGLVLVLFGIFQARIEKKFYNPLSLFLWMWGIIIILAQMQLYNMKDFDEIAYFIIVLGCAFSIVGYYAGRYTKTSFSNNNQTYRYEVNMKILFVSTVLLFLFYAIIDFRVYRTMSSLGYNYSTMRTFYLHGTSEEQEAFIYGNSLLKKLDLFIFRPMIFAVIPISVARFSSQLRFDWQIIIAFISVIEYSFVNFGRIVILQLIMQLVFGLLIQGRKLDKANKKKVMKRIKKYIIPMALVLILIMFYLSNARQANKVNSLSMSEEIYAYVTVSVPLLSKWIKQINEQEIYTYGLLFIKGFMNFLMTFLGKVGVKIPLYEQASMVVNSTETFYYVFPNHSYNAFVSLFYFFYADFRGVGVALGSLLYGFILGIGFKNVQVKNRNIMNLSLYLLLMTSLLKSFSRWEFVQMSYCLAFIWIFIWIKRVKIIE